LDTLCHVSRGIYENCLDDESREVFKLPNFLKRMLKDNMLGSKTKQGFYKKIADKNGKSQILSLDLKTFEYSEQKKVNFDTLNQARKAKNRAYKFKILILGNDRASDFYKEVFAKMFAYVQNRVPEISDDIASIDSALKAGFGWKEGPFEIWNYIGVKEGVDLMKSFNLKASKWIEDIISKDINSFYK
jgi:3-hydroxyacyl-CoA dehydrogenase